MLAVLKTHPISGTGFSLLDLFLAVIVVILAVVITDRGTRDENHKIFFGTYSVLSVLTLFGVSLLFFALMFSW